MIKLTIKKLQKKYKYTYFKRKCKLCPKIITCTGKTGLCLSCALIEYWKLHTHPRKGKRKIKRFPSCIDCPKKLSSYHSKRCRSCETKRLHKLHLLNYIDGRSIKKYHCIDCGKQITESSGFYGNGRCPSCSQKGDLNNQWNNGSSFEPYTIEFNAKLKTQIRQRDNYTCQECGIKQKDYYRKLDIHHIDYNKANCKKNNLITLCFECNIKANHNRDYWFAYFTYIMEK